MSTLLLSPQVVTEPSSPGIPARSLEWSLGLAVLLALGTRAAVLLTSVLSVALAEPETLSAYATGKTLMAWDSVHYQTITVQGYPNTLSPLVAFFPFYPLLARPLTAVVSPEVALLTVANVATVLAAVFVFLWARVLTEPRTAILCTGLMLAYPPALFCSAAYTEGLFLLLTALVFWLLQRQLVWSPASLSGFATGLRPTGVALAVLVLLCSVRQVFMAHGKTAWVRLASLGLLSVSGLLAYQLILWQKYQQPDAYFRAQDHWSMAPQEIPFPKKAHLLVSPWEEVLAPPFHTIVSFVTWNKVCIGAMLALTIWGLLLPGPIPRGFFLMPLLIFLLGYLPGWGMRYMSLARFETAALPCFLLAAFRLRRVPRLGWTAVVASFGVQLFYAWEFSRGRWMG